MARNSKIRITKNDRTEYARLVKNTKAKIRRTDKKYGVDLSNEIEIPDIDSFKTRKEFNEWKQKQSSFTNRANTHYQFQKNAYGVVATKHLLNEIEKNTRKAQKIADELREKANEKPFISGGKEQGTIGQRMLQMGKPNTAGISRPPDFDFSIIRTYRDLLRKKENMEKRSDENYFDSRMEKMKENFIWLIQNSFNSDGDDLAVRIKNMPTDDFYEMYLMFDEFDFDLYYNTSGDPDGTNPQLKQLESYVDRYERGQIDMSLKGF